MYNHVFFSLDTDTTKQHRYAPIVLAAPLAILFRVTIVIFRVMSDNTTMTSSSHVTGARVPKHRDRYERLLYCVSIHMYVTYGILVVNNYSYNYN